MRARKDARRLPVVVVVAIVCVIPPQVWIEQQRQRVFVWPQLENGRSGFFVLFWLFFFLPFFFSSGGGQERDTATRQSAYNPNMTADFGAVARRVPTVRPHTR